MKRHTPRPDAPTSLLRQNGAVLLPSVLHEPLLTQLVTATKRRYQAIETIVQRDGPETVQQHLPPGQRYVPTASSCSLEAVYSEADWQAALRALTTETIGTVITHALGGAVVCDLDQAWVRRQYAPHRSPPQHAPHGWHQDGALRFDFAATATKTHNPAQDALLPMVTCWVALTPCGIEAPGLEVITRRLDRLLPMTDLTDTRLHAAFPADAFYAPAMKPGDVLLLLGGTLHRTHVLPCMRHDRTSVEFRFVAADKIPSRLQHDRFF